MSLGHVAFSAYREAVRGINVNGGEIPQWDDLGDEVQHAWQAAGQAAVKEVTTGLGAVINHFTNLPVAQPVCCRSGQESV